VLHGTLIEGDVGDRDRLDALLAAQPFDALLHFAAHIWVGESVRDPAKYYRNNTANAVTLFEACARRGLRRVVFSSTAAVYGQPDVDPISEEAPLAPINPYGASKLFAERVLDDMARAHGLSYVALRYFNVAGADPQARIGEATPDNSHLIKVACETVVGLRPRTQINGTDYPTPDGTCIRDYIHVEDLAAAHLAALDYLGDGGSSVALNCGYGHGHSVREVLDAVQREAGAALEVHVGPRRPGDAPSLVAATERIRKLLGWSPRCDDLGLIVRTALAWERKLRNLAAPA